MSSPSRLTDSSPQRTRGVTDGAAVQGSSPISDRSRGRRGGRAPRRDSPLRSSDPASDRPVGGPDPAASPKSPRSAPTEGAPPLPRPASPLSASSPVPRTPSLTATPSSRLYGDGVRRGDVASTRTAAAYRPTTPRRSEDGEEGLSSESGARREVYGTTVRVDQTTAAFRRFFSNFPDSSGAPLYPRLLDQAILENTWNINVNAANIQAFDNKLYRELVMYPTEIVPVFDMVVDQLRVELNLGPNLAGRVQVRIFNLLEKKNMRELNPEDIDTMVAVKGMVIRVAEVIPEPKAAFFLCIECNRDVQVVVDEGTISEPTTCPNCNRKKTMALIHNRGVYADRQVIKMQETPDTIPEGETPHTVTVHAFDNLVDVAKPGDRVEVTAIYRAQPVRLNPRKRTVRTIFRTYLDAVHIKKADTRRFAVEDARASSGSEYFTSFDESDLTQAVIQQREEEMKRLGSDPNIYEKLTRSIAPNIWEMENEKKGILCLLFGGTNHEKGAGHGRFRGELNVLLCGDPGTSKSQLLQYVHKIAPRGIYTSGKGSSAVGLTASIMKDPESHEMVLESGALVLSDRGVCCIDEFDKMSDSTRSILHEVMEQQTVSIAKAGIVCTLNARTSILASANPIQSRYNPNLSVVHNIQLGPTLLSRFDLIYLVLDQPVEARDRRLGKHIISLYHQNPELRNERGDLIPGEMLTHYISYARRTCHPVISDEAVDLLVQDYVAMRKAGYENKKVISATPRQLESLIRISEALARMRLSNTVERRDVNEASRLMECATQKAATDPKTGKVDMSMLSSGVSANEREAYEAQSAEIVEILRSKPRGLPARVLVEPLNMALVAKGLPRVSVAELRITLDTMVARAILQRSEELYSLRS